MGKDEARACPFEDSVEHGNGIRSVFILFFPLSFSWGWGCGGKERERERESQGGAEASRGPDKNLLVLASVTRIPLFPPSWNHARPGLLRRSVVHRSPYISISLPPPSNYTADLWNGPSSPRPPFHPLIARHFSSSRFSETFTTTSFPDERFHEPDTCVHVKNNNKLLDVWRPGRFKVMLFFSPATRSDGKKKMHSCIARKKRQSTLKMLRKNDLGKKYFYHSVAFFLLATGSNTREEKMHSCASLLIDLGKYIFTTFSYSSHLY